MFTLATLDIAIGLILVFLLMSFLATAVREAVEQVLKTRAVFLFRGIRELLHDADGMGLVKDLYEHPLISGLYKGPYAPPWTGGGEPGMMTMGKNLPSYLPSKSVALALLDIAARGATGRAAPTTAPQGRDAAAAGARVTASAAQSDAFTAPLTLDRVRANVVANIPEPRVQRALLTAIDTANGNLARAQANVAAWYDSSMDRVSGWYKRRTQTFIFAFGLFVTLLANVNTLTIAERLSNDASLRSVLVAEAEAVARDTTHKEKDVRQRYADLEKLGLPIGWKDVVFAPPFTAAAARVPFGTWAWYYILWPLFGWLLTAIAVSLGAPFWFDVLNKVMVIRSTVKPREKSQEEGSEDRQPAPTPADVVVFAPAASPAVAPVVAPPVASPISLAQPATPPPPVTAGFEPHQWASGDPHEGII